MLKGTCTLCGKENCNLTILDDIDRVCDQCLESDFQLCDVCGEYYDPGNVEFFCHIDGRLICEYCKEDFDDDDFEDPDEE